MQPDQILLPSDPRDARTQRRLRRRSRLHSWVYIPAVVLVTLAVLGVVFPHFDHAARSRWIVYAATLFGTWLISLFSLLKLRGLGRRLRDERTISIRKIGRPLTMTLWLGIAAIGVLWLGLRQYVLPVAGGLLAGADAAVATVWLARRQLMRRMGVNR